MSGAPGDGEPWWQAAFAADYLTVYAHRDQAAADAEVAGILPRLGAGPVLDACCGNGRHLAALRRRGVAAVGFDWSMDLLRTSRAPAAVARGDVREIPFSGGFSAVLVLFTAFGYFDEGDNRRALAALAAQLAPGGRLLLDLPDPELLRRSLVPHSERAVAGLRIREDRRLEGPRVLKDVHITHSDGRERRYTESVRLYAADELAALAAGAGLVIADCWSGLTGPAIPAGRCVWWLQAT